MRIFLKGFLMEWGYMFGKKDFDYFLHNLRIEWLLLNFILFRMEFIPLMIIIYFLLNLSLTILVSLFIHEVTSFQWCISFILQVFLEVFLLFILNFDFSHCYLALNIVFNLVMFQLFHIKDEHCVLMHQFYFAFLTSSFIFLSLKP